MLHFMELIERNGHALVKYDECEEGRKYMRPFDYSSMYGGTYDGFRFYNNYVVDIGEKNKTSNKTMEVSYGKV